MDQYGKPAVVIGGNQGGQNNLGFGVNQGPPNAWAINRANDYGPARGGAGGYQQQQPPQQQGGLQQQGQIFQGFGPDGKPIFGPAGGLAGGLTGGGDINSLISQQQQQNNQARQQQQALWDELKKYMQGIPGQYTNDPRTKATQGLTSQFLANPEALNDNVVAKIKNQNANQIGAQTDNAFKQQSGILAAQGDTDASTLAAMRARLTREGMAQQTGANTNLEIQRAQQRNQDYMNALNQGRAQTQADIGVPMQVGQSLLQNQPQFRADDLTGLGGLALANQNQQAMLAAIRGNQGGIGGSGYQNPGDSAYRPVGYSNQLGFNRGDFGGFNAQGQPMQNQGAGFGFNQPPGQYQLPNNTPRWQI